MTQTIDLPILGLDNAFPELVYVLPLEGRKLYVCLSHNNLQGLACFEEKENAEKLIEGAQQNVFVEEVEFDEAREIAKERPPQITCLILADNLSDPKIHYVR